MTNMLGQLTAPDTSGEDHAPPHDGSADQGRWVQKAVIEANLSGWREVFHADVACLVEARRTGETTFKAYRTWVEPAVLPALAYERASGPWDVCVDPESQRLKVPALGPEGEADRLMVGELSQHQDRQLWICLRRTMVSAPFSPEESALLERVLPAMRSQVGRILTDPLIQVPFDVMAQSVLGMALLGCDNELLYANASLLALCRPGGVFRLEAQRLVVGPVRHRKDLHEALSAVREGGGFRLLRFEREAPQHPLMLLVECVPGVHGAGTPHQEVPQDVVRLTVLDPQRSDDLAMQYFAQAYGLTRTETGIVTHIAAGLSVDETASALGIARSTVRWHLKHVFSKTHTDGRARLLQLLINTVQLLSVARKTAKGDSSADSNRRTKIF